MNVTSQIRPRLRWPRVTVCWVLVAWLQIYTPIWAQSAGSERVVLPASHKPLPAPGKSGSHAPAITRPTLTPAEASAPITIEVALRMRDFAGLQARVHRGEIIAPAELAASYHPAAADYQAVIKWLTSQGLTIARTDPGGLAVFASGTASQLAAAFQVTFARVTAQGAEWTSAITAPSLPAALAGSVLGVNGLQQHIRPHKHILPAPKPSSTSATTGVPYWPRDILRAYGGAALTQTGAGQTIGIVIDTNPSFLDLNSFWATIGSPQTLSNMAFVQVVAGTLPSPSGEETLDVEWASGLAPGAKIRVYTATDLAYPDVDQCYAQAYTEVSTGVVSTLHQLSMSFGEGETDVTTSQLQTDEQYFAELAAVGVSVFASIGDGGSSPDDSSGGTDGPLQVESPACSTSVTAVGGTSLVLAANSAFVSETVWNNSSGTTGGGTSIVFPRPVWQVGPGVPAGSFRVLPDVAGAADPVNGALLYFNRSSQTIGGTSWAAPSWAAFCALINQARASASLPSLGLLGPRLYPLLLTPSFRDILGGSNGAYNSSFPTQTAAPGANVQIGAGVGYNQCTGLGPPNLAALLTALSTATASVAPPLTYQWSRLPAGGTTWLTLTSSTPYSGATTATLSVAGVTTSMSGDQFRCTVTNTFGATIGLPAGLIVSLPALIQTVAGVPGTSGGVNGSSTSATFNFPEGIAADSAGNIYLGDAGNNLIRKITPLGVVSTYAGSGAVGETNSSTALSASFNGPAGVAWDATTGNLYVADYFNNAIRTITPTGAVSLLAGGTSRHPGYVDSTGASARFVGPADLKVDSTGNIYVADQGNNAIRKITPAGVVTTLAGGTAGTADGTGTAANFYAPGGIGIDGSGNLYVADSYNHTVRKITMPGAVVTTLAGSPGVDGNTDAFTATAARFFYPGAVQPDAFGNVYVVDSSNSTLREILASGAVITVAGVAGTTGATNGLGPSALFNGPGSIVLEPAGTFAIADSTSNTVRRATQLSLPAVQISPATQSLAQAGNAVFTATLSGMPAPTCQWQMLPAGATTWVNLTNTATISGSTTATLTVSGVVLAMNGTQFQCVVTNAAGIATSSPSTLAVPDTFASWQSANFTLTQLANPAISGPAAILGPDSSSNLLKYALGVAPTAAVPASAQTVSIIGGVNQYTYTRPGYIADLTYSVQISFDLQNWTSAGVSQQLLSTNSASDLQTWQTQFINTASAVFFRLLITKP